LIVQPVRASTLCLLEWIGIVPTGKTVTQPRRRKLIVASIIIALAIGLIIVSVPYLPQPTPGTLSRIQDGSVLAGSSADPGFLAFQIPSLPASHKFILQVNTTALADFCVMSDTQYHTWLSTKSTSNYGPYFPWSECLSRAGPTAQTTISFTPPSSGTWDVIVLNSNPSPMNVTFSPALV